MRIKFTLSMKCELLLDEKVGRKKPDCREGKMSVRTIRSESISVAAVLQNKECKIMNQTKAHII